MKKQGNKVKCVHEWADGHKTEVVIDWGNNTSLRRFVEVVGACVLAGGKTTVEIEGGVKHHESK